VALAVAVSAFGVLNAQLLSGPRLIFAMSRDGRFGRRFQALNARGAPAPAILLLGSLAILLLMVAYAAASDPIGAVDQLLTGVVFVDGLFFILTGAALLVLRRRRPTAKRPVRVPLFPAVPILFVVGEGAVVTGAYLDPDMRASLLIGIAWIAAAAVLYAWRFRKQALPDEA
jgi:APA family basic amino acid/polyamine antiporter